MTLEAGTWRPSKRYEGDTDEVQYGGQIQVLYGSELRVYREHRLCEIRSRRDNRPDRYIEVELVKDPGIGPAPHSEM